MLLTFSQVKNLKGLTSLDLVDVWEALDKPFAHKLDFHHHLRDRNPKLLEAIIRVLDKYHIDLDTRGSSHYDSFQMCAGSGTFSQEGSFVGGEFICQERLEDSYLWCDRSDEYYHRDYVVTVHTRGGEETWSEYAAARHSWVCDDCGERFSDDVSSIHTDDDNYICDSCYENEYSSCESCGIASTNLHEYDGTYLCCECYDQADADDSEDYDRRRYIQSYSTRAENTFSWGKSITGGVYLRRVLGPLYMGIELEVEVTDDVSPNAIAGQLLNDVDNIICCEDGSLTNGFEIKTPPMDLNQIRYIFEKVVASDATSSLRSHNGGNCGLHINLSRAGLSQMQQAKILFFFNSKKNESFLKRICRRFSTDSSNNGHTNYSRVSGSPRLSEVTKAWSREYADPNRAHTAYCTPSRYGNKGKVNGKRGNVNDSRYSAVNFTADKVEIRLPRGTLKRNTLLANLELAAAVVEFTRTGEMNAGSGRYVSEFQHWMMMRPRAYKDYPELVKFCIKHGFLGKSLLPNPDVRDFSQTVAALIASADEFIGPPMLLKVLNDRHLAA